jgi:hypothetical protein
MLDEKKMNEKKMARKENLHVSSRDLSSFRRPELFAYHEFN